MRAIWKLAILLALGVPVVTDAEPTPQEHWITYGGDFTQRHAMDTLSVRHEGDFAHIRYLIIGRTGPLKTTDGPVAYIIQDFVFDCARQTENIARVDFYDRSGGRLRSREFPEPEWLPSRSAVSNTFRPYACGSGPAAPVAHPYDSLNALLQETYGWWDKSSGSEARKQ